MDVMSLDTNIQQNEGILKLSVAKHMKMPTKTTHPTHYLPVMVRSIMILKENFFHFNERTTYKTMEL